MSDLYRIKPLEWILAKDGGLAMASSIFGFYSAFEDRWTYSDHTRTRLKADNREDSASSLEEAKAACESHYHSLLMDALEKVED